MSKIYANIPETGQKRIVIVGAGFGGLTLAQDLDKYDVQVVLIDKNNYHQFQPLFYQVAMAGIEPSSISFPIRKIFQHKNNVHVRVTEVQEIEREKNRIKTKIGIINYDYLVLAMGCTTNFYGNDQMKEFALPMKSVTEAIYIRNRVLQNFEDALSNKDEAIRAQLMTVIVVGGGPTGVEIAGTLAEMKKMILPKDYPEINFDEMKIYLFQSANQLLKGMSDESSEKSKLYLERLGVIVKLNDRITEFDGQVATTNLGEKIATKNVVWAAGVRANSILGFNEDQFDKSGRILVNEINQVKDEKNIFVIGDQACMISEKYPFGHPQMAQPAIQQGKALAENLFKVIKSEQVKPFEYKDKGSMATIGRNLAVVDLPFISFQGIFAWFTWMIVHLFSILGLKNKIMIMINWIWHYFTYDQSLRLIFKPRRRSLK